MLNVTDLWNTDAVADACFSIWRWYVDEENKFIVEFYNETVTIWYTFLNIYKQIDTSHCKDW